VILRLSALAVIPAGIAVAAAMPSPVVLVAVVGVLLLAAAILFARSDKPAWRLTELVRALREPRQRRPDIYWRHWSSGENPWRFRKASG
jgi:uncharacterized membrane protein YfcA